MKIYTPILTKLLTKLLKQIASQIKKTRYVVYPVFNPTAVAAKKSTFLPSEGECHKALTILLFQIQNTALGTQ